MINEPIIKWKGYLVEFIIMDMSDIYVIPIMDWLIQHLAYIDF